MIRRTAVLMLAAGLVCSLGGCMLATKEQVTTVPVPHQAGSGLNVTAHNGHITVHTSRGPEVQVIATLRMVSDERLAGTTISANRDSAGVLTVTATPPSGLWRSNEGCGFDITLPDAKNVTLKSDNGAIEVEGLSGTLDAKTSNGRVMVASHDGPVKASSSNGHIEVAAAGPIDCRTSNGSVKVTLLGTGPVDVDTSNGSVSLILGNGYAGTVSAKTSNGSISAPSGTKSASTSYAFERSGRSHAKLTVGNGGNASSIETSNGGITISFAP